MLFDRNIQLDSRWPDCYLEPYVSSPIYTNKRKALLIIPGGGYHCVCADREGEPIALEFLSYGYQCFVLHYSTCSTSNESYPAQLVQAALAMQYIKDHADEYKIDAEQVFVIGFSAGGHLAGCLATMWHRPEIYAQTSMPVGYPRPAGAMLIYPVVTGKEAFSHKESFQNLLASEHPSPEDCLACSLECTVDERSSPVFLVHTANDQVVGVENSLLLAAAYAKAKISFELHIFPDAPHGVALANEITRSGEPKWENPSIALWVRHGVAWMNYISGGNQHE